MNSCWAGGEGWLLPACRGHVKPFLGLAPQMLGAGGVGGAGPRSVLCYKTAWLFESLPVASARCPGFMMVEGMSCTLGGAGVAGAGAGFRVQGSGNARPRWCSYMAFWIAARRAQHSADSTCWIVRKVA